MFLEATIGFEPMNKGFADLPLKPLGYVAICIKNSPNSGKKALNSENLRLSTSERETRLELATSTLARLRSTN
jgi:hypothetical protein